MLKFFYNDASIRYLCIKLSLYTSDTSPCFQLSLGILGCHANAKRVSSTNLVHHHDSSPSLSSSLVDPFTTMPPLASSIPPSALAHRPQNTYANSPLISSTLAKPFCPPLTKRASTLPSRKKRKLTSYAEDIPDDTTDPTFTDGPARTVLGGLDINALKSRRRESGEIFRKTFIVPVKENGGLASEKRIGQAPSLGMLRPANFVARPLHDPAGEFAIVLYDPTIDDEPTPKIADGMVCCNG
jgi:hypothetical protein